MQRILNRKKENLCASAECLHSETRSSKYVLCESLYTKWYFKNPLKIHLLHTIEIIFVSATDSKSSMCVQVCVPACACAFACVNFVPHTDTVKYLKVIY